MTAAIETPSGKNEETENFPVAKLLSKPFRKHVEAFYIFARAADDISDNPTLNAQEKVKRLDQFDAALMNDKDDSIPSVIPLRNSLKETGVTPQHARDLLVAFKRDATKLRYENWDELMDYCRYSAAPVGRYLLDLHGESKAAWPANDALCSVLQILNHLQDCAEDYKTMNRVYIPLDMMAPWGVKPELLKAEKSSKALRRVLDLVLDQLQPMIWLADTFPGQIRNPKLRMNTAVINRVAVKLVHILRQRDPLCQNVKLSKADKINALILGAARSVFL